MTPRCGTVQVIIFVKSVQRCMALAQLLLEQNFPAIAIHRHMTQEERSVYLETFMPPLFHGHPISPRFNNSFKHSPSSMDSLDMNRLKFVALF